LCLRQISRGVKKKTWLTHTNIQKKMKNSHHPVREKWMIFSGWNKKKIQK
jgi:hypothetical protein